MSATSTPTVRKSRLASAVAGLLAGSFGLNGLPHIYFGLSGLAHMTPFGANSSPGVNLAWGAANLLAAAAIAWSRFSRPIGAPFVWSAVVGAVGTLVSLVMLWA